MTLTLPQLARYAAPALEDQKESLEELYSLNVLDASSDTRFDHYTKLAASTLDMPMAAIVLIDQDRLHFKSLHGVPAADAPRDISFVGYVRSARDVLIVPDASTDPRFSRHPLVQNKPHIRFCAGGIIRGPSGQPLGAVCVMDRVLRSFQKEQQRILLQLTRLVEHELLTRTPVAELREKIAEHALVDPATHLPSRTLFITRLTKEIESSRSKPLVVALMREARDKVKRTSRRARNGMGDACQAQACGLLPIVAPERLVIEFEQSHGHAT